MMQWVTMFQKEMMESWRNKKWIWVPIVFIILAVMDPISTYYLPEIIQAAGGFPDGTVIELGDYAPAEIIMMSLSQYSTLGVLLIAFLSMGTVAGEKSSGVSELILVKPVSYTNYITAKWASLFVLIGGSSAIGLFAGWYYTVLLYGNLAFTTWLKAILFYSLWLLLVISVAILFNSLVTKPGIVVFLTILSVMLLSLLTQVFGHILTWSPVHLSSYIQELLLTGTVSDKLFGTAFVTIALSIMLLILSVYSFQRSENR
ncbi:ABC transporter permease [Oceanobacillus manasiensis]|uniref:ABC transporter permease n=1 Tax=Oceanobacillus manasiensis TaxID=586413 RepID=UPI0005AA2017|nr:ABC transporter permease subunit [Oceanobacillus manasiensis]